MVTFCNTRVWSENLEKHFHLSKNLCSWRFCGAVFPWLMRCSWQAKDHVKQILHYMVHSIDKKIVKKFHLMLLLLYYKTVLWNFFWHFLVNRVLRIRAIRNRINQGIPVNLESHIMEELKTMHSETAQFVSSKYFLLRLHSVDFRHNDNDLGQLPERLGQVFPIQLLKKSSQMPSV